MAEVHPTTLALQMPPDPKMLRVLRLVGSGLASLGQFDLAATEEVRVAVDELGAALIAVSSGAPIELTFDLSERGLCVEGSTAHPTGVEAELDPLTDRMLSEVASTHEWSVSRGRAVGRIEKLLPGPTASG